MSFLRKLPACCHRVHPSVSLINSIMPLRRQASNYLGDLSPGSATSKPVCLLFAIRPVRPPYGVSAQKTRVGRGNSSGRGNTSGRGQKGRTARSGGATPTRFEGGQTPITRAFPKRGFTPLLSAKLKPKALPLGRLKHWLMTGKIDATKPITMKELADSRCVKGIKEGGVKLLADVSASL